MKVHIDTVAGPRTGPGTFADRLARQLFASGVDVSLGSSRGADVSLVFIEPSGASLCDVVVQRLDGIWSKPNEFHTKNAQIRALYERADAVVHQSNFDRRFIERSWGPRRNAVTIHNGISTKPVTSFTSPALEQLRQQYDVIFACSANWHAQKRLKSNTEAFFHLRSLLKRKCCMVVMGSNPDHVVADKDVFYTGSVPEDVYMQVYSMANWMIHLAWRDHCPNTNIECLSQQTPIICSSDSGSAEIIAGFGLTVEEAVPNDLEPFDYDNPPSIDVTQLTSLPDRLSVTAPDVSIARCADSYVQLFKTCLST